LPFLPPVRQPPLRSTALTFHRPRTGSPAPRAAPERRPPD
jgi:hypothetical protein